MSCFKCNIILSNSELEKKIKCDLCTSSFCQTCSGLSATEIRVMQLSGRRMLKFLCGCKADNSLPAYAGISTDVLEKLKHVEDKFVNKISDIKADLAKEITSLKEEVFILRESNIQLVHMLTKNNKQIVDVSQVGASVSKQKNSKEGKQTKGPSPAVNIRVPNVIYGSDGNTVNLPSPVSGASAELTGNDVQAEFSGVEQMKFLHLNNVSPGVSPAQVRSYIIKKHDLNDADVSVKQLTSNDNYSSFKIGIRESMFLNMMNPAVWPNKVKVREFSNNPPRRPRSFNGGSNKRLINDNAKHFL